MNLIWKILLIESVILVDADNTAKTACEIKAGQELEKCNGLMGCFVTSCEQDGSFTPYQCHGSVCWCVDNQGDEISNTRIPISSDLTAACQQNQQTKTVCEIRAEKDTDNCGGMGCFITVCVDGSFRPYQCLGSVCWCVDSQGDEISNTRIPISSDLTTACQQNQQTKTVCEIRAEKDTDNCGGMGCFITVCVDGSFRPYQCLGSVCWCVDSQGDEISNTRIPISSDLTTACQQNQQTKTICEIRAEKDTDNCGGMGCFITVCVDGSFRPYQCLGSVCWCVDSQGDEISNTRIPISSDLTTACEQTKQTKSACEIRAKKDTDNCGGIGCFITVCVDGLFRPYQCLGSMCWCVDSEGNKITNSDMPISSDFTACSTTIAARNPASVNCIKQGGKIVIRNTPSGEVGYCVFQNGAECEEWSLFNGKCVLETKTQCELKHYAEKMKCGGNLGCFITKCESDGSFTPLQCHGSSCWCVDSDGKKISKTETSIGSYSDMECENVRLVSKVDVNGDNISNSLDATDKIGIILGTMLLFVIGIIFCFHTKQKTSNVMHKDYTLQNKFADYQNL